MNKSRNPPEKHNCHLCECYGETTRAETWREISNLGNVVEWRGFTRIPCAMTARRSGTLRRKR